MKWLRRLRGEAPGEGAGHEGEEDGRPAPARRAAPALSATFEGLDEDAEHAVLDVGTGTQAHLRLYGRFARRIRFLGLLPGPPAGPSLRQALRSLDSDPAGPYHVVLLWNVLDWLDEGQRRRLIEGLDRATAPGARLYCVVDPHDATALQPLRFTPVDTDRVSLEPVGRPAPAGPALLPAAVHDLLAPFQVRKAFTLRLGHREYAAVKEEAP